MFSGLRLNEICQLHVADIDRDNGVDIFHVREAAEDQHLKTAAAERVLPIHPELRQIGFMAHVQAMKTAGQRRLFPDLSRGKAGYYSDPFGKWFGRYLTRIGAKTKRTGFHSFRHCFRDALREADVSTERVKALGGWAATETHEAYGGGYSAQALYEEICKVKYPGLDLSRLHEA